jgi:hypothetical protein
LKIDLIHAYEDTMMPEVARHAADLLAGSTLRQPLAPNSPHLIHMAGHIYFLDAQRDLAHAAFMAARRVDELYMNRNDIHILNNWNYIHNVSSFVWLFCSQ